jgi:ketosteroid isomerase-like protein
VTASNAARAATLTRALHATFENDSRAVDQLYTDDVKAWTPLMSASSAADLKAEFARRDDAFSDIDLDVEPLDVGGAYACAEWRVSMTHSGPLTLGEDTVVDPTGLRIVIHGATVAEFDGERICSLRQYWDPLSVLEQLGVVGREESTAS